MFVHVVSHRHANMYFFSNEPGGGLFLFDCGWQDSFPLIKQSLRGMGAGFDRLRGVLVSHFHPDHAGCLELLRRHGVTPVILERQIPYSGWLNAFFENPVNDPGRFHVPFDPDPASAFTPESAQELLRANGLDVRVLHTPGHTPDSVGIAAGGCAFTGDLEPHASPESWLELQKIGVRTIFGGHWIEHEWAGPAKQ